MATFPAYARLLFDGYQEARESALLRTEMEDGPPKQARVRSRVLITRTVTILLHSRSEYLDFLDWYSGEINEGASWFDFRDPTTQTVKQARFISGGFSATPLMANLSVWNIHAQIETWG